MCNNQKEYIELHKKLDNMVADICSYNLKLIHEYPFLKPSYKNYDYTYTALDQLPSGWRITFGLDMLNDIKRDLKEQNILNTFKISKFEFNPLRIIGEDDTSFLLSKYTDRANRTCKVCGKEIDHKTDFGLCKKCEKNISK